jgi:hypothetical protein
MSLRPMIYAVDLAPLITIANSNDASMAERVGDSFWSRLMDRKGWTQERARQEAFTLLSGGLYGKPETETHVCMVHYLAEMLGIGAEGSVVADGAWKISAWGHYLEHVFPQLGKWPQELLSNFFGRPLFGTEIQTSWSHYGYLLGSEVDELLTALRVLSEWPHEKAHLADFHQELISWLEEIRKRKSDLWLYAY